MSAAVLLMFVGGWLLLFCQNCLAVMGEVDAINLPANESSPPCRNPGNPPVESDEHTGNGNVHCLGVCDCDDIDTSFNNFKFDSGQKYKFKNPTEIYFGIPELVINMEVSKSEFRILTLPEQAILIPLKHFTVLLN